MIDIKEWIYKSRRNGTQLSNDAQESRSRDQDVRMSRDVPADDDPVLVNSSLTVTHLKNCTLLQYTYYVCIMYCKFRFWSFRKPVKIIVELERVLFIIPCIFSSLTQSNPPPTPPHTSSFILLSHENIRS